MEAVLKRIDRPAVAGRRVQKVKAMSSPTAEEQPATPPSPHSRSVRVARGHAECDTLPSTISRSRSLSTSGATRCQTDSYAM